VVLDVEPPAALLATAPEHDGVPVLSDACVLAHEAGASSRPSGAAPATAYTSIPAHATASMAGIR
jgi:hypothetical protein